MKVLEKGILLATVALGGFFMLGIGVVLWIVFGQSLMFGRQLIHLNLAIVLGTVTLVLAGIPLGGLLGGLCGKMKKP